MTVHAERDHKSANFFPQIFADFALTDLFLRLYKICCGQVVALPRYGYFCTRVPGNLHRQNGNFCACNTRR